MGALADIDLLTNCTSFLLPQIHAGENKARKLLPEIGSTVHVNSLRSFPVQRSILAVGMFSLFESALQAEYGWTSPFSDVAKFLNGNGENELLQNFENFRLAVNVLKHGEGPSLEKLLLKGVELPFRVKRHGEWFDGEGDVVEGQLLVDVTDEFVAECATLITEVRAALERLAA